MKTPFSTSTSTFTSTFTSAFFALLALPLAAAEGPTWSLAYEKDGATNVVTSASNPSAIRVALTREGDQWSGVVSNGDDAAHVLWFEVMSAPFAVDPASDCLYLPWIGGARVKVWPHEGWRPAESTESTELAQEFDKEFAPDGSFWMEKDDGLYELDPRMRCPGIRGTMQWMTVAGPDRGFYFGSHDPRNTCKNLVGTYDSRKREIRLGVRFFLWLRPGREFVVSPVVMADYAGTWHAAARRYREWWDRCYTVAKVPDRVRDMTGAMIVILKQQNDEIVWPYTEFDSLGACAKSYGFEHVEFHGWGVGGHDRLYPEYDPDPLMGGREGLVKGLKTLREMGVHATAYSNGQLQERETTRYWRTKGKGGAIRARDGSDVTETWHKFKSFPAHHFDIVCYWQKAWQDQMLKICRDARGYGFEGFFYDQTGVSRPRQCFAAEHGHEPGDWVYTDDRRRLFKTVADMIHSEDPEFVLWAEGYHDGLFDSTAVFEGWDWQGAAWHRFEKGHVMDYFPEMTFYAFPEIVATERSYTPSYDRRKMNSAVVMGCRINFAVRYRVDRDFVERGIVPTAAQTADMISPTDHEMMAAADWAGNRAYCKVVGDFRRAHRELILRGRFRADEGFSVAAAGDVVANRWDAADGRTAILVWNGDLEKAQAVTVRYSGQLLFAEEPEAGRVSPEAPIPANSLRLYVFKTAEGVR